MMSGATIVKVREKEELGADEMDRPALYPIGSDWKLESGIPTLDYQQEQ